MFHSARIKLTAWYLVIVLVIITIFSGVIYRFLSGEVERFDRIQRIRMERRIAVDPRIPTLLPGTFANPELVTEAKQHIVFTLLSVDAILLVISGILGYFLAGMTLAPIQTMLDEQHRFVSDASHELKTPLTSLKTTFEVYLRSAAPTLTEARTVMQESVEEVNKLETLSESLLRLAHQQTPRAIPFATVSLSEIIQKAMKKIEPMAKKKKQLLHASIDTVALEANEDQLIDLFVVLLDNAVKYSPTKTTVEVVAQKTDGSVTLSITDHGIGIAKEEIPHIFKRFYRADSARTKTSTSGYGLGLAIAKNIVDAHHGTINVTSTKKTGTTFTVTLPMHQSKSTTPASFFSWLSEKLSTLTRV